MFPKSDVIYRGSVVVNENLKLVDAFYYTHYTLYGSAAVVTSRKDSQRKYNYVIYNHPKKSYIYYLLTAETD